MSNNSKKINLYIPSSIQVIAVAVLCFFLSCKGKNDTTKLQDKDTTTIQQPGPVSTNDLYAQPQELLFTGKRESDDYPGPLYPRFFPIGWSKDGNFAYAEEPVDEACGCYFFHIHIKGMQPDTLLWKWELELEDTIEFEAGDAHEFYFKKTWEDNKVLFSQKLKEYGIEPMSFSRLEKLPLKLNGNEYQFRIRNKTIYVEGFGLNMIATASVSMLVNGAEKKRISNNTYSSVSDGKPFSMVLSNNILGYLKSPDENRISLFYKTEQRGWEGPPNVIEFEMIGVELK